MKFGKLSYPLLISTTLITQVAFADIDYKTAFVIDAGSTGSRLYQYKYHYPEQGLPDIDDTEKSTENKDSGIQDASDIKKYLEKLFTADGALLQAPNKIYFYSTAGMRLTGPGKREKINTEIEKWLKENYPSTEINVKTISGKVEGAYTWLAVNHLKNTFKENPENRVGIMDMGGASTQIVFEDLNRDRVIFEDDLTIKVSVNNEDYYLFSKSFLRLGQDQALLQFLNQPTCFPVGYPLADGRKGTGKFNKCTKKARMLINNIHNVKNRLRTNNSSYEYTINESLTGQNFYAKSAFYYTAKNLKLTDGNNPYNLVNLKSKGKAFCSRSWDDIKNEYTHPEKGLDKYVHQYCFSSAYQYALLSKGYKLNDANTITPKNKIMVNEAGEEKEKKISWTYGPILSPNL